MSSFRTHGLYQTVQSIIFVYHVTVIHITNPIMTIIAIIVNSIFQKIALGIITLVLQSIGSAAILSALNSGIKDFVLIGNLTLLPQCKEIYPNLDLTGCSPPDLGRDHIRRG